MDKQTLGHYGWIIVITLILSVMIALATPFGSYVGDGLVSTARGLVGTSNHAVDGDNVEDMSTKFNETLSACTHANSKMVDIKEPTCTEKGYMGSKVCAKCEKVLEMGEELEATGHQNISLIGQKGETCAEDGYTGDRVCDDCHTIIEKGTSIPKLDHATEVLNVKKETCTTVGYTGDIICKVCGSITEGEEIPATGHQNTILLDETYVAPTCEKAGKEKDTYCNDCKTTIATGTSIASLGHIYGDFTSISDKEHEKECQRENCTSTIKENHTMEVTNAVLATCITTGEETYECTNCEYTYDVTLDIDANNHINTEEREDGFVYCNDCSVMTMKPGLYDTNNTLIASWEDLENNYGYNIEQDVAAYSLRSVNVAMSDIISSEFPTTTKIVLPSTVTQIKDSAFSGCNTLTHIYIPNGVQNIGMYAFDSCSNLLSIVLPDSIMNIDMNTFQHCTNLTSVTLSNSLTEISDALFYGCTSLTSIIIPNTIESIGEYAFYNCTNLTSITIPNNVLSIGYSAFYNSGLISITIPNSTTYMGNAVFNNCTNLVSATLGNGITEISTATFYGCTNLTSVTIPNYIQTIGSYAFHNCSKLTSITIPSSVKTINAGAFELCTNLTNIIIPNTVTTIDNSVFSNNTYVCYEGNATGKPWGAAGIHCNATTAYKCGKCGAYMPGLYDDSRNRIMDWDDLTAKGLNITKNYASSDYSSSTTCVKNVLNGINNSFSVMVVDDSITNIGNYAFNYDTKLSKVVLPTSVTSLGEGAFANMSSLTYIKLPSGIKSIPKYAFKDCSSLTEVIPQSRLTSIGYGAFMNDKALTKFSYSSSAHQTTSSQTAVGDYAFYNCSSFDLSGGDSNHYLNSDMKTIGAYAFAYCTSNSELCVHTRITSIGAYAFYDNSMGRVWFMTSSSSVFPTLGTQCFYSQYQGIDNGSISWDGEPVYTNTKFTFRTKDLCSLLSSSYYNTNTGGKVYNTSGYGCLNCAD